MIAARWAEFGAIDDSMAARMVQVESRSTTPAKDNIHCSRSRHGWRGRAHGAAGVAKTRRTYSTMKKARARWNAASKATGYAPRTAGRVDRTTEAIPATASA